MEILHVAAHLGGGVGKAHASIRMAMPDFVSQTYCLLEEPRDLRYADEIAGHGGRVVRALDLLEVAGLAAEADIVQFEFWNHPRLYEVLALAPFGPMRSVFWSHVSGLYTPVIAKGLIEIPDRFVFTTPASRALVDGADRDRFPVISSGFAFSEAGSVDQRSLGEFPIAYLGTVDFVKMSEEFFAALGGPVADRKVAIWGSFDPTGDVYQRAMQSLHAARISFMGQTGDPRGALLRSNIFFYPLQSHHYGTAENALVEAMSLGLVPVVLDNPAERTIVSHGTDGFVARNAEECNRFLALLLEDASLRQRMGDAARHHARDRYTAEKSANAFTVLWNDLAKQEKRIARFDTAIGTDPLSWFRSTIGPDATIPFGDNAGAEAKGTLAHFRSIFPDAECWKSL